MPSVLPRPGTSRLSRLRGAGAVAAVTVLMGTAALAPFSVSDAAAEPVSYVFDERTQRLRPANAEETFVDAGISVSEVERTAAGASPGSAVYTLEQFMFSGAVNWGGYKFTYYSQQVLPGSGLEIPGRHVNEGGYVSDADGFIVLAGSAPKGTVYDTPFGYRGKIYDRGTVGNHLDVYIR